MGLQHPPRLKHLLGQMKMFLRLRDIGPTHILLSYGLCFIYYKTQEHTFLFMSYSVPSLPITPSCHMRLMSRGYSGISKVPRTRVLCSIHSIKCRWTVIIMHILWDCGYMKILKSLFVL